MNDTFRASLAAAFILIITLCAVFVCSRLTGDLPALDLTQNRLYTLSDGTRHIVDRLQQPVTIKLFYSKEGVSRRGEDFLVIFNNYFHYVRDLLHEYRRIGNGRIKVEVLDPRPYSEVEAEANDLSLKRFPLSKREGFYFGMAVYSELGKREVIDFFPPTDRSVIEYRITELIDSVSRRAQHRLGIISSLPVMGEDISPFMMQMREMQGRPILKPWLLIEQLRKGYELSYLPQDTTRIDNLDLLLVIHPKGLSPATLFAIDQYVMRGGKAVVFVDPYCLSDQPRGGNPLEALDYPRASDLNRLLTAWGVRMVHGEFAGDANLAQEVRAARDSPEMIRFVGVLQFKGDHINQQDPITARLGKIETIFAGVLEPNERTEDSTATVVPLITTSSEGNTWKPKNPLDLNPMSLSPARLAAEFEPGNKTLMLACKISGKLKSAFPDGPPPESRKASRPADPPRDQAPAKDPGPEGIREPAVAKSSDAALEPDETPEAAGTRKPNGTEMPGAIQKPSATEQPGSTTNPEETKAPVSAQQPDTAKKTVGTPEPGETENPAATPKPSADKNSGGTQQPVTTENPGGTEKADGSGQDPTRSGSGEADARLAASKPGAVVIVVADVDLISDVGAYGTTLFGTAARNNNVTFVLNALESLSGSSDLIAIRSRARVKRPFTVLDEIERQADARTAEKVKKIQEEKARFESELERLVSQATEQNVGLVQNEVIEKQRELESQILEANRKLRDLQKEKLDQIERLGIRIKNLNRLGVPGVVLLVGVILAVFRYRIKRTGFVRGKHE